MSSPALEQWLLDPAPDPRDALIADLTRERDALLYACRVALAHIEAHHRVRGVVPPGSARTCQRLRDAISMAEGGEGAERATSR